MIVEETQEQEKANDERVKEEAWEDMISQEDLMRELMPVTSQLQRREACDEANGRVAAAATSARGKADATTPQPQTSRPGFLQSLRERNTRSKYVNVKILFYREML